MPDQSSAATEHAILQEITAPLGRLPDDPVAIVRADFPAALRGYDRMAVDAYVKQVSQLVAELQATRSPEAAVRRALERVGEQISGILQRAHETAEQITSQSRSEAEDRLEQSRQEAAQIIADAQQRVRDLDADTDRIWAERHRIVSDTRELAGQLVGLADTAAERFPPAEEPEGQTMPYDDRAHDDDQAHTDDRAHADDQAHTDDRAHDDNADATVAFPAVDSRSDGAPGADLAGDDAPGADLAYEDAAVEPDYGDAAVEPVYGGAAAEPDYGNSPAEPDYGDATAELAYEDAAPGMDTPRAAGTPPPVAAEERPGEHDSTAVIPPASQAAHRRAGS
jgi:cell division septum initiation protein DivIVA